MLADNLGQQVCWDSGDYKSHDGQPQWMRDRCAVATLTDGKAPDKRADPRAEVHWKAKNGTQLDHDSVHLPIAIGKTDVQQRLGNAQVRSGADGKKLGQPFKDAQQ